MDTNKTQARDLSLGGFDLRVVEVPGQAVPPRAPVVLLLHGFSMRADDLAPFGASMGLPGVFVFPEGPIDLTSGAVLEANRPTGRAWWMIDVAGREAAIARGDDRDLSTEQPAGLAAAREGLSRLVAQVARTWPDRPFFLGGFSQGAILSLDLVVRSSFRPSGLVLLSGARVDAGALAPFFGRVHGLPIFQSHGVHDRELAYSAADTLRRDLLSAGADVSWWPFAGGHELPLVILRELKKFLRKHAQTATTSFEK